MSILTSFLFLLTLLVCQAVGELHEPVVDDSDRDNISYEPPELWRSGPATCTRCSSTPDPSSAYQITHGTSPRPMLGRSPRCISTLKPQSSVQDFPVITPTSITQMYTPSSSSFEGSATATSEINSFPITYTESSYQSSSSQTTSPISSPSLSSALSFQGSSRATSASTTSSV
ncbi:hypothetical protein BDV98DRAFT_206510 [Pterulicium gracile]|uniref:REJ domain-containing protein n=1 Tax=Pterulicium gracile TaxID=1884261 RepID=A0A5C3QDL5_9AGAR|nr:hypothetical protein BDV98DRAFT_206510 [Pterula gracilis]